ncbi:HtaA domain-containing protein [Streptomyces sp. NBC_01476]|uniref:HtaA domain-containing protein n=1 Tax=Streptomyces sp. NBC_01476 TaxID=2903881 RepID=UPI002E3169D7|nr:HtaA domain-containing protein [Streptomyces sp. NBC_01476]
MPARPTTTPRHRPVASLLARPVTTALSALVLVAGLAVGLVVHAPPAAAATATVDDATLTWSLDSTANSGAYFGGCNFLSAGAAGDTGASKPWTATTPSPGYATHTGNVTVEKPNAAGTYAEPTWATKCQSPSGSPVTTTTSTQTRVRIAGGTGSIDPAANTATVQWTGSFTSAFYGGMVYWTATDPKLTVNSDGTGKVTATLSGYGADMTDPSKWAPLPATPVTLADLTGVTVTDTGFTVDPAYRGVAVTLPSGSSPQYTSGSDWGSWPQSFVDFQALTGESSYWYSSNLNDTDKVAQPISVAYSVTPPTGTGSPTTAPTGSGTPTTTPPTTGGPSTSPAPTTSVTPTTPTTTPTAGCTLADGVKGGSLVWGFKKSFRSYVISGGGANHITASDGAQVTGQDLALAGKPASGTFLWPFASSPSYVSASDFTVHYGGTVEFSYPAHFFDITIADPELVVKGAGGTLYADVTLTMTEPGKAAKTDARQDVALASLDLAGSSPVSGADGITRVLHTAIQDTSAFTFDGTAFYQKGQALDDATVLLSGCTGTQPPGGDTGAGTAGGTSGSAGGASGSGGDTGDGGLIPTVQYRPGSLAATGLGIGVPLTASVLALLGGTVLVASVRVRVRRQRG